MRLKINRRNITTTKNHYRVRPQFGIDCVHFRHIRHWLCTGSFVRSLSVQPSLSDEQRNCWGCNFHTYLSTFELIFVVVVAVACMMFWAATVMRTAYTDACFSLSLFYSVQSNAGRFSISPTSTNGRAKERRERKTTNESNKTIIALMDFQVAWQ